MGDELYFLDWGTQFFGVPSEVGGHARRSPQGVHILELFGRHFSAPPRRIIKDSMSVCVSLFYVIVYLVQITNLYHRLTEDLAVSGPDVDRGLHLIQDKGLDLCHQVSVCLGLPWGTLYPRRLVAPPPMLSNADLLRAVRTVKDQDGLLVVSPDSPFLMSSCSDFVKKIQNQSTEYSFRTLPESGTNRQFEGGVVNSHLYH